MKSLVLLLSAITICTQTIAQKTFDYYLAPQDSSFDIYFGDTIADPYQWMENPEDLRLAKWLDKQQSFTRKRDLQQVRRSTLLSQITSLYQDSKSKTVLDFSIDEDGSNVKKESIYAFRYNSKEYNRTQDLQYRIKGKDHFLTLVDTKSLQNSKSEKVTVENYYLDKSENSIAVLIARNGTDWREIHLFDLKSKKKKADVLYDLRIGCNVIWGTSGFFYDAYDTPAKGRELLDRPVGQELF